MKKLSLLFLLIACLCAGNVFAQKNSNQCENYGNEDFYGEDINLNLVNAELKDILNLITEKFGCNFIVDKSAKVDSITVEAKDVPWNILLDAILKSQDLSWMLKEGTELKTNKKSKLILISTVEKILRESECSIIDCLSDEEIANPNPLYTEFIKLKYISVSHHFACCFGDCQFPPTKLEILVKKLISQRGSIEIDSRTNSLIIADTKERIASIRKQVEKWDKPENDLDKIIKSFENSKRYSSIKK